MEDLLSLKGIGPKTLKVLNRLGITSINDLIQYYPFRFEIIERSKVSSLNDGDKIIIDGVVENIPSVIYIKKNMNKMTFRLGTNNGIYPITIFNRAFLKSKLKVGQEVTIIGKYDKRHSSITASDIKLMLLPNYPIIEPIYHTVEGISSRQLSDYIHNVLNSDYVVNSYIPEHLKDKYHLMDKDSSIREIHTPSTKERLQLAINTLKYEELFLFMLKMHKLRQNKEHLLGIERNINIEDLDSIIAKLPFTLTIDQVKCLKTIINDLNSNHKMNRLLQGDVGSGKTIIAFLSLYANYLSGYQGSFMAPTEILAKQHYQKMVSMFKDSDINIALLTGKLKVSDKKKIYEKLINGKIDVLIGTHALFSEGVIYDNLGLVITDEQHRFGVNQRAMLNNKGNNPDILYLSATPIPRTYAITLYGDMDISSIKTVPSGRKEVTTIIKTKEEIKDILRLMHEQLKLHHQIYVIAPLIEDNESEVENVYALENNFNKALGKISKIGVLHGKMSLEDKDEVMNKFKNNDIQILISTTVIEVGVDVANATMIVIFNSERFGLSQLHQLRGRVGRNSLDSYCILVGDTNNKRLNILVNNNDGFKISEADFKMRGSGDLFGIRQSGDMNFKLANIKEDFNIILCAKEDSNNFFNSDDYYLPEYQHIHNLIESDMVLN